MHEMGLAQGIVAVVEDAAGDRPVARISVRVGAVQAVAGDSLEFNFRLLTEGTPLQSTELVVTHVAGDGILVDEIGLSDGAVIRRDLEVVEAVHAAGDHHTHPAWR